MKKFDQEKAVLNFLKALKGSFNSTEEAELTKQLLIDSSEIARSHDKYDNTSQVTQKYGGFATVSSAFAYNHIANDIYTPSMHSYGNGGGGMTFGVGFAAGDLYTSSLKTLCEKTVSYGLLAVPIPTFFTTVTTITYFSDQHQALGTFVGVGISLALGTAGGKAVWQKPCPSDDVEIRDVEISGDTGLAQDFA